MKNSKTRNIISLILNILMVILVIYAVGYAFTAGFKNGAGNMDSGGFKFFRYFTTDSNVLAGVTSLILIPFNIKSLINKKDEIPSWALLLKFVGTIAVTVTFMVVLLFLGPTQGYEKMFENNCLELHLICPLVSIVSFCLFEKGLVINKNKMLLGLIPVIIYGVIYYMNVIVFKNWKDFYGFNINGFWYISFIVVILATALFSYVIAKIHNKFESLNK